MSRAAAVLGFVFDPELRHAAFIRKEHPEWMKGLWNAPGGHIAEGESGVEAVSREVFEETKLFIKPEDWVLFLRLTTPLYDLSCFWAITDPLHITTTGMEQALVHAVENIGNADDLVRNTAWMLMMAWESAHRTKFGNLKPPIYLVTEL